MLLLVIVYCARNKFQATVVKQSLEGRDDREGDRITSQFQKCGKV